MPSVVARSFPTFSMRFCRSSILASVLSRKAGEKCTSPLARSLLSRISSLRGGFFCAGVGEGEGASCTLKGAVSVIFLLQFSLLCCWVVMVAACWSFHEPLSDDGAYLGRSTNVMFSAISATRFAMRPAMISYGEGMWCDTPLAAPFALAGRRFAAALVFG